VSTYSWYKKLKKPSWAPPSWLFGPVWTFLYILIAVSFGKVFLMTFAGEVSLAIALPFILNLIFNFIFTPIQFGLRNNLLAAADIVLVWTTLAWSMIVIYPITPWVVYLEVPYIIWVSIATVLQLTVTYLNW
jgi:tryptophan-rich sensory protein